MEVSARQQLHAEYQIQKDYIQIWHNKPTDLISLWQKMYSTLKKTK